MRPPREGQPPRSRREPRASVGGSGAPARRRRSLRAASPVSCPREPGDESREQRSRPSVWTTVRARVPTSIPVSLRAPQPNRGRAGPSVAEETRHDDEGGDHRRRACVSRADRPTAKASTPRRANVSRTAIRTSRSLPRRRSANESSTPEAAHRGSRRPDRASPPPRGAPG